MDLDFDFPPDTCTTIACFFRSFSDGIADNDRRSDLLTSLLPRLAGTRSILPVSFRRACLSLDWLTREFLPIWIKAAPALAGHASDIQALPEIKNADTAGQCRQRVILAASEADNIRQEAMLQLVEAAGVPAKGFVRNLARRAVRASAGDAALAATNTGAWLSLRMYGHGLGSVARIVASCAAGIVAAHAAEKAATVAAGSGKNPLAAATGTAAREALTPTIEAAQVSACRLIERMIECD